MLGLSLSHADAQKRLKDEKASAEAALAAERAAHARAIQKQGYSHCRSAPVIART